MQTSLSHGLSYEVLHLRLKVTELLLKPHNKFSGRVTEKCAPSVMNVEISSRDQSCSLWWALNMSISAVKMVVLT